MNPCNKCHKLFFDKNDIHKYCDSCHDNFIIKLIEHKKKISSNICIRCNHNKTRYCSTDGCINVVMLCISCNKIVNGLNNAYCCMCI